MRRCVKTAGTADTLDRRDTHPCVAEVAPGQPYVTSFRVSSIWYVWLGQLESVPDVISTSTVVTSNRERGTKPTVALYQARGSLALPVALSDP